MPTLSREVVSRAAALVLGAALLLAAWKCLALGLMLVGSLLAVAGVPTVVFVLMPTRWVEGAFRPRTPPDSRDVSESHWSWWDLLWWW